jgi:hypothetical protein
MNKISIPERVQDSLRSFLSDVKRSELIATYLYYVEQLLNLKPVLFVKDKMVYQSAEKAIGLLEEQGKLWRETEIKIGYGKSAVNAQTKKIYICPFTGKVFGDNTHPNPQDAIYDWVAKCPENTERSGGVKAKRFFISEDSKVIEEYAKKCVVKAPVTKIVFSSAVNGKIFYSKEAVIEDFTNNYLKRITLAEVQGQSRYQIEQGFMKQIEEYLREDRIASFVEALSEIDEFVPYVESWLGEVEQEA